MKIRRIFAASTIVVALFTAGCNSFKLSENSSQLVDIQKRAILVGGAETTVTTKEAGTTTTVSSFRVCAEPSPDAMSAMAMEAAAKGGVPGKVSVELSAALQQSAAFVGLRTTSIQLLRDFGYRLCEAHLSGAINNGQYDLLMRRFQKNVVALLAIEQLTGAVKAPPVVLTSRGHAETSQSLSDQRDVREKVSEKIATLEEKKKKKESEKADLLKTEPPSDTKDLVSQIADIDAEITRRKADIEAIDKGIANGRGTLAGGETEANIKFDSSSAQRSGENIQAVAAIVGEITMAIVKSDDITQECLLTLGNTTGSENATRAKFSDWCQEELKLQQKERDIYLTLEQKRRDITLTALKLRMDAAEKTLSNSSSTPEQKREAIEILGTTPKEVEKIGKKENIGGIGLYREVAPTQ